MYMKLVWNYMAYGIICMYMKPSKLRIILHDRSSLLKFDVLVSMVDRLACTNTTRCTMHTATNL